MQPWYFLVVVGSSDRFSFLIENLLKLLFFLKGGGVFTFLLSFKLFSFLDVNTVLDCLHGFVQETEGVRKLLDIVLNLLLGCNFFLKLTLSSLN